MIKRVSILFIFVFLSTYAQEKGDNNTIEINYFYGNVIEHSPELKPIIQAHPSGILMSWNKKKLEDNQFNQTYNFPDAGFSATYHDFNTKTLGKVYSAYAHYNFYLNKRNAKNHIKLTTAFGLGYATNPFDKINNSKNWAIGSKFLASAYIKLNYQRAFIVDKLGVNTGFMLIHHSNTSFKAPNLGINTLALNVGLNYNLDNQKLVPQRNIETSKIESPIHYNVVFRTGMSESKINGSGLFPFYTASFYANKKLNYKSTITAGTDVFFATFLKRYIQFENAINETTNNADWKRIGVFVGHELNMERFSVVSQIGYHIYAPYKYVSGIYERFGFKKQLNEHLFADLTLKVNLFRAEGLEFGVGYQF